VLLRDHPFLRLTLANVVFSLCSLMFTIGLPIYLVDTLRTPAWLLDFLFALNTTLLAVIQTTVVHLLEPYRRTRALLLASGLWGVWCGGMALALQLPAALLIPYLIAVTSVYTLAELIHAPTSNALAAAVAPLNCVGATWRRSNYRGSLPACLRRGCLRCSSRFGRRCPG
jgi:hypothetical protein